LSHSLGKNKQMNHRLIKPQSVASALLGCLLCSVVSAQAVYPTRPVTLVVPFPPGGFTDNVGRFVAQGLSAMWNSPVVVENKGGAGGNLGAAYAVKQPADGYTIFLANTATNVVNPLVYKKLEFDPDKDFDPVILVVKTSNLITVSNSLPAGTLAELVALSKSKVGGITFGFPGNGTTGHFTGALFNKAAGIGMVPVPYKGTTQVQADLIGGTLDVAVDNITTWAPLAQTGRVRAVAVTGAVRSALLPDVPTVQESGYPGFEATSFAGIASIAGTPLAIIQKLNADIARVLKSPEFGKRFSGGEAGGGSPEDFKRHIAAERQKWGEVAKTISLNND